ncbi:putative FAD-linked oxidoreductase [Colletotrichum tropicale]|nr:putative FAD-linked oxidoreductase [Colletotrichum tropicale]
MYMLMNADQVAPGVSILATDNVVRYDVVPGNGTMAVANASSNANQFWALKGGANNFGSIGHNTVKVDVDEIYRIYEVWNAAVEDISDVQGLVTFLF